MNWEDAFHEAFPGGGRPPAPQPEQDPAIEARARELTHDLAQELAAAGPDGWRQLEAMFALTHRAEVVSLVYSDGERFVHVAPYPAVSQLVREHRELSARMTAGPWWRMELRLSAAGQLEVNYDYGDLPFPDEHRFPPDVYRADLADFGFPTEKLPMWLASYLSHGNRQLRSPRAAVGSSVGEHGLPDLSRVWTRWAVISAAFVAIRSAMGPRILPSHARFEGASRSGSALWLVPGGRAVLSGGVWNAPELAAAYRGDAPFPDLFAGAPEWVADPLIDARGAAGLLSFCYWWDGARWCRGESPGAQAVGTAVPGVWTAGTVAAVVSDLAGRTGPQVARLVEAAEDGSVRRDMLIDVFGSDADIDGAFHQLVMADVAGPRPMPPLPENTAIAIVRDYILGNGLDSPGYRAADLAADRVSAGWAVYVPVPDGQIMIGRTIFYVADDGVMEQTTSHVPPPVYEAEFEQRFRERNGL